MSKLKVRLQADQCWPLATNATGRCCGINGFAGTPPAHGLAFSAIADRRPPLIKGVLIKVAIASATVLLLFSASVQAQGDPSGRGPRLEIRPPAPRNPAAKRPCVEGPQATLTEAALPHPADETLTAISDVTPCRRQPSASSLSSAEGVAEIVSTTAFKSFD